MPLRPLQFSLRRMFVAVAYVAAGCAILAMVVRAWRSAVGPGEAVQVSIGFLGPFVVIALLGAAVGELFGNARKGAIVGILVGVALLYLGCVSSLALLSLWQFFDRR